jgi:demethylmenaquinone methyltransferase/2-methoxy-6-polyprenyl-1,4-benzoquinol methylase
MTQSVENDRAAKVNRMFSRVAKHYDRANRWMTWGQDIHWRREVVDLAALPKGGRLLDIGTGTGDLAVEALHRDASSLAMGADFTVEMMTIGRLRRGGESVRWVNVDAMDLPFPSGYFDAVVSGYLLRNVVNLERSLAEQYRVLKNGGHVVSLDTTPPPNDFWHLPVRLYLRLLIPLIGWLLTGESQAYKYLSATTEHFLRVEELAGCFQKVGFTEVKFRRFMGGSMAIHWGRK